MLRDTLIADSPFGMRVSPREKKRIQRIEEIIETAAKIFVSEGYAQFSARRVAAELGISLSNLQHYCGTTENLLVSMIRAKIESFVTRFREVINDSSMTPHERLLVVLNEDMAATLDPWIASFSFQVWALADHDKAVNDSVKKIYSEFCQLLAELIRKVNPSLSVEKSEVFATLIASQIEGLLLYNKQVSSTVENWDATLEIMKTLWVNAILAGGEPSTTD